MERGNKIVFSNEITPEFVENASQFQGYINRKLPRVTKRTSYKLRLGLFDEKGKGISESVIHLDVFPKVKSKLTNIYAVKSERGIADKLVNEVGARQSKQLQQCKYYCNR